MLERIITRDLDQDASLVPIKDKLAVYDSFKWKDYIGKTRGDLFLGINKNEPVFRAFAIEVGTRVVPDFIHVIAVGILGGVVPLTLAGIFTLYGAETASNIAFIVSYISLGYSIHQYIQSSKYVFKTLNAAEIRTYRMQFEGEVASLNALIELDDFAALG